MPKTQFAVEMGMGTDLKGRDYTKAACRAVHDALHRNFLSVHRAFDFPVEAMLVDIRVGVAEPDKVDLTAVAAEAPAGQVTVEAVKGGLDVGMLDQNVVAANAIVTVSFDVEME